MRNRRRSVSVFIVGLIVQLKPLFKPAVEEKQRAPFRGIYSTASQRRYLKVGILRKRVQCTTTSALNECGVGTVAKKGQKPTRNLIHNKTR